MKGFITSMLLSVVCFLVFLIAGCGPPEEVEKAIARQREAAEKLGRPVEVTNSIGMKLCLIPDGEFMMGVSTSDENPVSNAKPRHKVEISKPFYIGACEVTQEQWQEVMGTTVVQQRDNFKKNWPILGEGANYPIYFVSWNEAEEFCRKLSKREGMKYRLPTEAEWEYACRAGSTTTYYWGDSADGDCAWDKSNSEGQTHPVGRKRANAWGLYDMSGNVWEWCSDRFDKEYYRDSPLRDPQGPSSGEGRVLRGGSWGIDALGTRSSYRFYNGPGVRYNNTGFRVIREVEDK